MWYEVCDLKRITDLRGDLYVSELGAGLPFAVKRFYILTSFNKQARGFHAHKALHQMAYCLQGHCEFHLDNGDQREVIHLNAYEKGLHIKPATWREMHNFSNDCIILVLASEVYDEADYIRSYDEFLSWVKPT